MGNGVSVLDGGRVELPEVNKKPEAAILLFHHDDWRGPGTVGGTVRPGPSPLCEWLDFGGDVAGKAGSLGLDGVLKQRSSGQVVLSLADYVAELLEEGF